MKKLNSYLLLVILLTFSSSAFIQKQSNERKSEEVWSGTVSFLEKRTGREIVTSEWTMFASFNASHGTANQNKKDRMRNGAKGDCYGEGSSELDVGIDDETNTYGITAYIPSCTGTSVTAAGTVSAAAQDETAIVINDQPLPENTNSLSGTLTIDEGPFPDGSAASTIYKWNLVKGPLDVELVVTPSLYDTWKPEPGADEDEYGNVMNIGLKVQKRNGGFPALQAVEFELRLSTTSREPGITINAPLNPSANPKPDIRFLEHPEGELFEEDQFIKIPCRDGTTGEVIIGSFDGGGWTILTADAILEGGLRIKGFLMQDRNIKRIPVPKNRTGGVIAESWLTTNGNPAETFDEESSPGNYNGDGLSAYEEYRGVISEGVFTRLKPQKKELGVKFNKDDLEFFSAGLAKFKSATGLEVIKFYDNEIPSDRRINQNASHATIYKQYALHLVTGTLSENQNGKAFGSPGIPSQVDPVMIDPNNINQNYQIDQTEATSQNTRLPYTKEDLFAAVVAHELTHGIKVEHHGWSLANTPQNQTAAAGGPPFYRIFHYNRREELTRPYPITGKAGNIGNEQSGDLNCIMAITNFCYWAYVKKADTSFYYEVPVIPLGKTLCSKQTGTGINANNKYFGDAPNGNCLDQLKLRQ